MSKRIFEGIKVLDLTRVLAGPWCTQALADMGAEVYKIERPGVGDEMRHSPPFLKDAQGHATKDTPSYFCVNRGKRSLTIDITQAQGQKLLLDLASRCDVLAENFKVGDLKRYGLDYESVRKRNPSIVYCSITGYGQDGPLAALPGYDPVMQAISGIMSTCGVPDGQEGAGPMRSMVPLVDIMTGMVATTAIVAALFHRQRTGEGQRIDTALLDVAMAATNHMGQNFLSTGKQPQRAGNGSQLFAPSNCFPCADGAILIQIGNDGQWVRLCETLGQQAWLTDERFKTNRDRMQHRDELNAALAAITQAWPKQKLADVLSEQSVPCGPVNDLAAAFENPQVRHRNIRAMVEHPAHGSIPLLHSPFRFSETPVEHRAPPQLGADTEAVLREQLGLTDADLAQLRASSVV